MMDFYLISKAVVALFFGLLVTLFVLGTITLIFLHSFWDSEYGEAAQNYPDCAFEEQPSDELERNDANP